MEIGNLSVAIVQHHLLSFMWLFSVLLVCACRRKAIDKLVAEHSGFSSALAIAITSAGISFFSGLIVVAANKLFAWLYDDYFSVWILNFGIQAFELTNGWMKWILDGAVILPWLLIVVSTTIMASRKLLNFQFPDFSFWGD
jgi:hypothetical protein